MTLRHDPLKRKKGGWFSLKTRQKCMDKGTKEASPAVGGRSEWDASRSTHMAEKKETKGIDNQNGQHETKWRHEIMKIPELKRRGKKVFLPKQNLNTGGL